MARSVNVLCKTLGKLDTIASSINMSEPEPLNPHLPHHLVPPPYCSAAQICTSETAAPGSLQSGLAPVQKWQRQ